MENEDNVIYVCIGKNRNKHGVLVPCGHISGIPTWRDVYLCSECANGLSGRGESEENVGAMQSDSSEFKDQIAAGFAAGASRFYNGEFEGIE